MRRVLPICLSLLAISSVTPKANAHSTSLTPIIPVHTASHTSSLALAQFFALHGGGASLMQVRRDLVRFEPQIQKNIRAEVGGFHMLPFSTLKASFKITEGQEAKEELRDMLLMGHDTDKP